MKRTLGLCALLAALAAGATAQDAHYWTYGYGPIGQLTEGTLVGGVSDLSAIYYNPGALALLDRPRFLINLTSIELANIDVPDAAGQDLDFDQMVFDVVPAMVAFRVTGDEGDDDQVAVAMLSRHDSDWDLGYSHVAIGASPDASAGYGRFRQRLLEYWVGGTWSHRLGDRLSVGLSPFVGYRAQRSRRSVAGAALSEGAVGSVFVGSENEYNHLRVLAKAGVAWRPGRFELGATVTAPGFKVWSNGKSAFNATVAGVASAPLLSASQQPGLSSTYRAPWSVAGGATWRREGTAVHTTVEWFSSVDTYDILELEPAPVAGSTTTIPLSFRGAAQSVLNFGAGLEHRLGDRLTLYGGIARDASAHVPERDTFGAWDLVDVTLGLAYDTSRARLAFGAAYAWGSGEVNQVIAPPGQPLPTLPADFSRWTFSIGASFSGSGR
jgi:long-subunit fatty acid transport protein